MSPSSRPKPAEPRLPTHISHSARETLERCAKSYFLKYLTQAPRRPALWLAGGSAVHEATEHYDRMSMVGNADAFQAGIVWERLFDAQLDKLREAEPNENIWRKSASEGDIDAWRRAGLGFVQAYIDWRERSPWEIWTTPDGEPAIELEVSGYLPGCPVEIKAFLDRVFWDPLLEVPWILDLKTSKKPPKTAAQFQTYAALVEVKYGVKISHGVPFMNRRAALGNPFDLSGVTPKSVGAVYGAAWAQVQRGDFPANGFPSACFICDVQ
ncbi:MAG TPA: PD-(D/E)XK nuclease family protein, partial [Gemmatimonadales bacterium]